MAVDDVPVPTASRSKGRETSKYLGGARLKARLSVGIKLQSVEQQQFDVDVFEEL